ncbi:MAG: YfhO family protein, partial [Eubacteriales bacterium]|nr:YfhO family protein [Eubacteriales bacterium]
SMFSSAVNSDVTAYMEKFGICGWVNSNRYTYQESSPFTNLMLNIKYLISPKGIYLDKEHMELINQSGEVKLLKNNCYLPQGFMVDEDLLEFDVNFASANPFDNQNEIFRLATGLDGNLYEKLEVVTQGHTDSSVFPVTKNSYGSYTFTLNDKSQLPHLKFNYTAPYDGTACAYFQCGEGDNVDLRVNDSTVVTNYVKRPYIMQMGDVKEGDKLSIYSDLSNVTTGSARVYCAMFNEELFQEGLKILSQSTFNCTESSDTLIEGTIDAKESGLFYTSISYDAGWTVYVDDEEVEVTPVGNALVAFKLSEGKHNITMEYCPKGFTLGWITSLSCILIFAALIILSKKTRFMKKRETEE